MEALIAAAAGSLVSAIVGAVVASLITVLKSSVKSREEARREYEDMRKLVVGNSLTTCRIAIYDEHFSVDEKIEAYELYKSLGGNHRTKTYMDKLVGMDIDEYLETHKSGKKVVE